MLLFFFMHIYYYKKNVMIIKKGSKGNDVKNIQEFLGLKSDGFFGNDTERKVIEYQRKMGLSPDGMVGDETMESMGLFTSDNSETTYVVGDLKVKKYYLPKGEYYGGPTDKEYLFLHHTAGWHNPYNQVDQWGRDGRGKIATEFLIGGQSVKGDSDDYDGEVLQCIPKGGYAWHLGKNGSQYMHTNSVGIEVCNFGQLTNGKTYAGTSVVDSQVCKLNQPFRGFNEYHKYSNEQLKSLANLIKHIGDRDNIEIRDGLISEIRKKGVSGFDYNEDAFYGKVKGMWTHTNTRKDKNDMYPCESLIDMLLSL